MSANCFEMHQDKIDGQVEEYMGECVTDKSVIKCQW